MEFLGCLGFLLLSVLFFVFFAFRSVLNLLLALFGLKPFGEEGRTFRFDAGARPSEPRDSARPTDDSAQPTHTGRQNEKIFSRRDDEYVDFEEVK